MREKTFKIKDERKKMWGGDNILCVGVGERVSD